MTIKALVVLVGLAAALTQQTSKDLTTVACIMIAAALYYVLYLRRRNASNFITPRASDVAE